VSFGYGCNFTGDPKQALVVTFPGCALQRRRCQSHHRSRERDSLTEDRRSGVWLFCVTRGGAPQEKV